MFLFGFSYLNFCLLLATWYSSLNSSFCRFCHSWKVSFFSLNVPSRRLFIHHQLFLSFLLWSRSFDCLTNENEEGQIVLRGAYRFSLIRIWLENEGYHTSILYSQHKSERTYNGRAHFKSSPESLCIVYSPLENSILSKGSSGLPGLQYATQKVLLIKN